MTHEHSRSLTSFSINEIGGRKPPFGKKGFQVTASIPHEGLRRLRVRAWTRKGAGVAVEKELAQQIRNGDKEYREWIQASIENKELNTRR